MADRSLSIRVSLKDYEKVQQGLLALGAEGHRALARIDNASQKTSQSMRLVDKATSEIQRSLIRYAATAASALSVREIVRMSDAYTLMQGRLKLVTNSADELNAVQARLFRLAQENRAGLAETVNLYTRLAQSSDQLGLSQANLIQLTDTVLKALRVGGATAQEAAAGVTQLAQALASGRLQGDEFRSMMESMPRLARALADGLGVSIGQLREMSKEGELTSKRVAGAALSQTRVIEQEFGKLPKTVGESLTQLGNSLTDFTGKNGAAQGAVRGLADALSWLSSQIDDINTRANALKNFTRQDVIAGLLRKEQQDLQTTLQLGPQAFGSMAAFEKMVSARMDMIATYQRKMGVMGEEVFGPPAPEAPPATPDSPGDRKRKTQALKDYLDSLEQEGTLTRMAARDRAIAEKVLRAENAARRDGVKLTDEQRKKVEGLAAAQYDTAQAAKDAEEASRKAAEAQKEMWRPVEHAFERIQDAFADMLTEGEFSAKSLVQIFKRAAAEIASAMIFRPVISGVFSGFTGGGMIPGVSGSVTGAGGGIGGISSLLSGGSSGLSGLLNGFTSPVINPGIAFDIGSRLGLGAGPTGFLHNALGNFTPLSGIAGFGGSMLANLFGLSGKYSSVGSTIGGIAGTAIGGPIGALAGSFLGSVLGGFGGGKPHPGASFEGVLGAGGGINTYSVLAKHMDPALPQGYSQQLSGFLQGIASLGTTRFNTNTAIRGIFDPAGGVLQVAGGPSYGFNPNDPSSAAEAMRKLGLWLAQAATVVDQDVVKALQNVSAQGKDAAGVLNAVSASLSFVKGLKEFSDALTRDPATTTASPEEQRKSAEQYFAAVSKKAAAGQAGAQEVQAAALAFLQASQAYSGRASSLYARDLATTQAQLAWNVANAPRFASGGEFDAGMFVTHPGEIVMTSRTPGRVLNARETQQVISGGNEGLAREFAAYRAQSAAETGLLKQQLERMNDLLGALGAALRRVAAA